MTPNNTFFAIEIKRLKSIGVYYCHPVPFIIALSNEHLN